MPELDVDAPRQRATKARRIGIAVFVVLVVAPLVTVAISSTRLFTPGGRTLEVQMSAKGGHWAQIFWSSSFAMSPSDSSQIMLRQPTGAIETLRFPLPRVPLETLRFDPLEGSGEVLIRYMRVVDDAGRTVRTINPMVMLPLNQIAFMRPEADGVRVVTTPDANDPMLVMRSSWLTETPRWYSVRFVTVWSLALVAGAVVALIVTALVVIVRDVLAGPISWREAMWFTALFLVIVWAKLALFERFEVLVPFWDQWDGEALTLYIPWADDGVTWRQMFTFHNEHRIFFSRLLALTEVVLNGQWDPQLQISVNAVIHAVAALVFGATLWLAADRRMLAGIVLAVALTFAPPFAIENTLAGFQSAFYFLVLFSGLALFLIGRCQPGTPAWLLGWFLALCCPFTVAGGILVLPGLAVVAVLRSVAESWPRRWVGMSVAALLLTGTVAYAALPPPIVIHAGLKTTSVRAFVVAFTRSLAFPWIDFPRAAVMMWLPIAIVGLRVLRRRLQTSGMDRVVLPIAAWVAVQCAATAYSRGGDGAAPTSRYLDMVALGYLANTAVLIGWLGSSNTRKGRLVASVAAAVWLAMTGLGLTRVSQEKVALHGPERRHWAREHLRNVRQLAITDNISDFIRLRGPQDVPYYSASLLATWLEHPYIKQIMPAAVRAPLDVREAHSKGDDPERIESRVEGYPPPVYDSYAVGGRGGESRFESAPIACRDLRHLRFEVASSTDWSGLQLSLVSLQAADETRITRPWLGAAGWATVIVRCPEGPFKVVAVDASPTSWLAFRPPAEVALGSALADSLIEQCRVLGFGAAALAIIALVSTINGSRISAER